MTVLDMIFRTIVEKDFDGLYNSDGECACDITDLAPCGGESFRGCNFGYYTDGPDWSDADFFIGKEKKK